MTLFRKLFYTLFYFRRPPWDTRISPPELMAFIGAHAPGRALDLGCGAGTNAITLAQHGWQAVGVDFVGKAIRMARRRASQAGVQVDFRVGDVTRVEDVRGPFDLVLDIGCFHSLTPAGMADYARNLERLLAPGGTFLLYAFCRDPAPSGEPRGGLSAGITSQDLRLFEGRLRLQDRQDGLERQRPSSWFTYTR
jgi:SAM-dependent methyltransferase